jgi:iron complex outermembrane recepter protein
MAKLYVEACLISCLSTLLISTSARAAETADASPAAAPESPSQTTPDTGLEEILVTAQRRSETLERTPVAVEVITGDTLARAQIVTESDLQYTVPGLQVRSTVNSEQLNYTLRGQTLDAFSGARPGVLPYLNEVQIGGSGSSSAFYDLQSVQVLKGPQGILFGRSATGGAVLFTTQKPTDSYEGYVQGAVGNYHEGQFQGAFNAPLIPGKVLLRVAGYYEGHSGFQENIFNNTDAGTTEREAGRLSLTVNFSDVLHNELVADYFYSSGVAKAAILSGLPANANIPLAYLYAGVATPAATATGIATLEAFTGLSPAAATAQYLNYFSDPKHFPAGITAFLQQQQVWGPYTVDFNRTHGFRNNNLIVTDATTFDLAPSTTIKNIFGYTNLVGRFSSDTDATPYALAESAPLPGGGPLGQVTEIRQASDELQLIGDALQKKLSYVTGFYFSSERTYYHAGFVNFDIFGGGGAYGQTEYRQKDTTYAAYAHSSYQLTDNGLSVNAGLRFTTERPEDSLLPTDSYYDLCGTPGYGCDQAKTYNKLSWQFGLEDQINPDLLLYAVSRRAHKSGGFNPSSAPRIGSAAIAGNSFDAEQVTDVEFGAKFQQRVADMPVRLNLAIFHDWEKDSQRQEFVFRGFSPNGVTTNVPDGRAYGVELDGQIQPIQWLTLGLSGSYLHADWYGTTAGSAPIAGCRGATVYGACYDQVPDAPQWSWTAYSDISIPVAANLNAVAHGDVYRQTSTTDSTQSENFEGTGLPAYTVANFRLGIEDPTHGWSVVASVKNAFNRVYYTGGAPLGQLEFNTLIPGDPRTYMLTARIKF